jgi:dTMP kinase
MFIVIEGIDGAGCETQAKMIFEKLKNHQVPSEVEGEKKSVSLVKYPDYERNVGKIIREFLYENKSLTPQQQFLLYTMQFVMDKEMIREKRGSSLPTTNYSLQSILIADRYFSTTLCYQTLEGISLDIAVDFAKNFEIEVPDAIFYLNVDPDIAIKRKHGEDKIKNFREKDFDFIRKTAKQYKMLVKTQPWGKWINIDGNKSVEEVAQNIYNEIHKLKIKNEKLKI